MDHAAAIRAAIDRLLTEGDSGNFAIIASGADPAAFVQIAAGRGDTSLYLDCAVGDGPTEAAQEALDALGFNPPDVGNPWQRVDAASDAHKDAAATVLARALAEVLGVGPTVALDVRVTLQ